ncbi:MAG: alpha/beta hydrolase, partial [Dehalococcoidia bacterium]|nr:alpha/beta hydrolase [Dehalococcoidia bacterium]
MKRGFVDSPDGQIHYRVVGEGPPVVVFHQTPESSRAMAPLMKALASHGYRVYVMDTMGYGDSDRPPQPYTDMTQFARSVTYFMDGLGIDKAYLVGAMTGAQIALQVAADFPERVIAVAVQEPFNWGTPERRATHMRIHRVHPPREDGGHLIELWNRSRYGGSLRDHDLRMREFLYVNEAEGAEVYEGMGWEGAAPYCMTRVVIWDITPKITAPVFVTYFKNIERHRALEKFLETLP